MLPVTSLLLLLTITTITTITSNSIVLVLVLVLVRWGSLKRIEGTSDVVPCSKTDGQPAHWRLDAANSFNQDEVVKLSYILKPVPRLLSHSGASLRRRGLTLSLE